MATLRLKPEGLSKPVAYSQVITVTSGRLVFIAGQTPIDANGNVVGVGDFKAQVNQVFENLRLALAAAGATFSNVVKVTQYIPNWNPEVHRPALAEARAAYMVADTLPVSTLLGIHSLARPEYLIEIDAIAFIDE
jgi:enamine deaminase RidA (YjgF/YER057c/UK114 family)